MTAPHEHKDGRCPVTGDTHDWCPKQEHDSRAPCPALNTLANHGYLPRHGKNISAWDIVRALRQGYNISLPLAIVLSFGGYYLIKQSGRVELHDFARHNCVEHDASLAHKDTNKEYQDEYAPWRVDPDMLEVICKDVPRSADTDTDMVIQDGRQVHAHIMSAFDVASVRVVRERQAPIDAIHAEIARGEMAIALILFGVQGVGKKRGIPVKWFKEWMHYERMPEGWTPGNNKISLIGTIRRSSEIRNAMKEIRTAAGEDPKGRKVGLLQNGDTPIVNGDAVHSSSDAVTSEGPDIPSVIVAHNNETSDHGDAIQDTAVPTAVVLESQPSPRPQSNAPVQMIRETRASKLSTSSSASSGQDSLFDVAPSEDSESPFPTPAVSHFNPMETSKAESS